MDAPVLARAPGVLWRRTLRGVLVAAPGEEEPLLVTAPGDVVWDLLEQPRTREELVDALARSFDAEPGRIESDLAPVLAALLERGALTLRGGGGG